MKPLSLQPFRSVAGEALGAPAATAAGVVIERAAQALGSGAKKVEEAKPAIKNPPHRSVETSLTVGIRQPHSFAGVSNFQRAPRSASFRRIGLKVLGTM